MKKYLFFIVLIVQLFAMEEPVVEVVAPLLKQFTGIDGNLYMVRFSNEADIGKIHEKEREKCKSQIINNQVRIAIIETIQEPKQFVHFLFADRIIYGMNMKTAFRNFKNNDEQVTCVLRALNEFATHNGIQNLTNKEVLVGENTNIWISPVHAATVRFSKNTPLINTYSFYEAFACLIKESNAVLAPNAEIAIN
ncbi:MAG: hypothetical protein ACK4V2_01135 [Pseudomonadota bacterium]|jgi:hypothetical protein|nr:hypothetical protein [Alphaproteobacteria bacterium]